MQSQLPRFIFAPLQIRIKDLFTQPHLNTGRLGGSVSWDPKFALIQLLPFDFL